MKKYMACSADAVDVSGVPEEIKILPLGHVHSSKGDFLVDDESIERICNRFHEKKIDLVIDYEHQTLKDVQAPAGGWIKELYKGKDAVVAKVEWTPKAADYLRNKEYKYLSPVVLVRKRDKKAAAITSVALTNTPAIDGMFAIANSEDIEDLEDDKEEKDMELLKIAKLLGLPENATEEDVEKKLKTVMESGEKNQDDSNSNGKEDGSAVEAIANKEGKMDGVILSLLGLKEDARRDDVAAAIVALKNNDTLKAIQEELAGNRADALVETALKEGKISAVMSDWAHEYALKDEEGFKSFMEKAPAAVPVKRTDTVNAPKVSDDYDVSVLKDCGVSMEDVKKYYKKEDE